MPRWPLPALGLAAATTGGAAVPGPARAEAGRDIGVNLSYHFGAGQPGAFGLAVEARVMAPPTEGQWSPSPGIGARLALVGASQLRLLVTPQMSMIHDQLGFGGEIGIGARFGREGGLLVEPGVRGDYGHGNARMTLTPRESLAWSAGLGGRFPDVAGMPTQQPPQPGRPLRTATGARAPLPAVCLLDRGAEGRRWADRARQEWASIPAFGELHDQLRATGAPAALQARALLAADDELRHAADAARVAATFTGGPIALDPPARSRRPPLGAAPGLARLVTESWIDGCLGEGAAARAARDEADHGDVARDELGRVAEDEQRHAELAWDILAFARAANPASTRRLLAPALGAPASDAWWQQARRRLEALLSA